MPQYGQKINDVVLAAGDAETAVRDIVFKTSEEIAAVVNACDIGLCRLVPHGRPEQRTYLLDDSWNVKVAVELTARGEKYFEKIDSARAGV